MAFLDWIRELPFVDDVVDVAELLGETLSDGIPIGEVSGAYEELREDMYWTEGEDGIGTRDLVLAESSLEPVVQDDTGRVKSGLWIDPHTGFESTDPADFHIDHRVPFKTVVGEFSGIYDLPREEQLAIYNDPNNLQVISAAHNLEKGAESPSEHASTFTDPEAGAHFLKQCNDYIDGLRTRLG